MIWFRGPLRKIALLALLGCMLPLVAACGSAESESFVSWEPADIDRPLGTPAIDQMNTPEPAVVLQVTPQVTDVGADVDVGAIVPSISTPKASVATPASALSTDELKSFHPNEIGVIPVMEYHVITTDPQKESDQFVRTADHLREDLQFLYDHNFYVIPMRALVRSEITAPAGKHPVVLTFDDATASQFRWSKDANGTIALDPNTAIGILEEFFAGHPDFGRGGFFAVLPSNCFTDDTPHNTMNNCTDKLTWMAKHGYEIGLHTLQHEDLLDVTDDEFQRQIGENVIWVDERVSGPGNMSRVLAMPFGNYPDRDKHQAQRQMMRAGFTYKGVHIKLEGALLVGANPTESPSSEAFDPIFIARIQAFKESLDLWFPQFEQGTVSLYTSDGDPDTVWVPNVIPDDLAGQFSADRIVQSGKKLIRYDDEKSGEVARFSQYSGKFCEIGNDRTADHTLAIDGCARPPQRISFSFLKA